MKLLICAYGDNEKNDKGIIEIDYDPFNNVISKSLKVAVEGKCNCIATKGDLMVFSEQKNNESFLHFYRSGSLIKKVETDYFYNYAQIIDGYILLSSYVSGVDAVMDLKDYSIVSSCVHAKGEKTGKSHFIHRLKDGRVVGVENGLNQIYLYKDINLEIESVKQFDEKGIRLMCFNEDESVVYLNTEKSNELLVLDGNSFEIRQALKLTDNSESFSGGLAISIDYKYVFVSNRREDSISIFASKDGFLNQLGKIPCGQIPRDLYYDDGYLFASCTKGNVLEVYKLCSNNLEKINEIGIISPITFEIKN